METRSDDVRIRYSDNRLNEFLPMTLEVVPGGRARLWVGDNRKSPQRGAGLYADTLAEADVAPLRAALASPEFAAIGIPPPHPPGVPMRTLSIQLGDGRPVEKHALGGESPVFTAAEQVALGIVKRLEAKPQQVVVAVVERLTVAPKPLTLEAVVTLRNPGTQPLRIAPLAGGDDPAQLELVVLRDRAPGQPERPDDLEFLEVTPKRIVAERGVDLTKPIVVPPGGAWTVKLRVPARLKAGKHAVNVRLATPVLDEGGGELGRCEVGSASVPIQL